MPVPIAGSLRFKLVSAKNSHTCAITTDARLFCWGDNSVGQLGDGTTTTRLTPHQVSGNRAYRQVDVGRDHTCAIAAADDRAYCWGANTGGQLGIGVHDARKLTPTLVAGGGQYKQVQAGLRHSCAVTTANQAFCWGYGRDGQIGDGKTALRFWPRAVAGGLTFRRVSTGRSHACGETPSDKVYCWGNNPFGGIGDGTMGQDRLRPVAVVGGLSFSQVAAGLYSTCGRTPSGVGYCWGFNGYGQLGDGTETNRSEPVKVADPAG